MTAVWLYKDMIIVEDNVVCRNWDAGQGRHLEPGQEAGQEDLRKLSTPLGRALSQLYLPARVEWKRTGR